MTEWIELTTSKCIFCKICQINCPEKAISLQKKERLWLMDHDACTRCGLCISQCPKDALEFSSCANEGLWSVPFPKPTKGRLRALKRAGQLQE